MVGGKINSRILNLLPFTGVVDVRTIWVRNACCTRTYVCVHTHQIHPFQPEQPLHIEFSPLSLSKKTPPLLLISYSYIIHCHTGLAHTTVHSNSVAPFLPSFTTPLPSFPSLGYYHGNESPSMLLTDPIAPASLPVWAIALYQRQQHNLFGGVGSCH